MGVISVAYYVKGPHDAGWAHWLLIAANEWLSTRNITLSWVVPFSKAVPTKGVAMLTIGKDFDGHVRCHFAEEDREVAMLFKLTFE